MNSPSTSLRIVRSTLLLRYLCRPPRQVRPFYFCLGLALLLWCALAGSAQAQTDECKTCEPVVKIGLQGSVCSSQDVMIELAGASTTGSGVCSMDQWMTASKVYPELKPDETYLLTVGPNAGLCAVHLNFSDIPEEYILEIDGTETTTIDKSGFAQDDGNSTWKVVLRKKCECDEQGAGDAKPRLGSVLWQLGLGTLSDGRSAQNISLRETTLTSNSYTPAALVYSPPGLSTEVDVVRSGDTNSLRQIKAPQALADIIVISDTEYDIRFYRAADVGGKVGGVYSVSGQPFVTWKIKNPDPTSVSRLQISKIENGVTDTSEYTWDEISEQWSLSTGGGTRVESKTVSYPTPKSRTETTSVKNNTGKLIFKVARTYYTFEWGEELVQEVIDPDGAALKTLYAFYENPTEANRYRRVKSIAKPDGSWEKYDYDSNGNKVLVLRPWKDQPLASATEANSYAVSYTYSNTDGIEVSLHPKLISSVTEKVAGTTVRKTTYTRSSANVNGEPAVTEVQTVYASASATEATSTTTYHSSASAFVANRVASVLSADGRKETYTYEKGNYVSNADPSLNQFTPDPNGLAERETILHGTASSPNGIAFKSTKETSVRDQNGHPVLQETHVYNGSGYDRIAWTVMDYDDRGHLTQTRRHNGQVSSSAWNGARKSSDTDVSGIEVAYTYDELGRVKTKTKKGVVASGSFPAQADIVTTYSYDAEGHVIGETVAGGSLSLSKSSTYDTAGRLKTETDQTGMTTGYSYANGGRTRTTTLPGGATKITDQFLDGQSKSNTGTAVIAQAFDYGVNGDGTRYTQAFTGSGGLSSPRWIRTTTDWLGRTIKVEQPTFSGGVLVQTSTYNNQGQLRAEAVMTGTTRLRADKLYEYDELGVQVRSGLDVDANNALTTLSADRMSETELVYEKSGTDWFRVSTSRTYLVNNDETPTIETRRERLTNFPSNGSEKTVSEIVSTDAAGNSTRVLSTADHAAKRTTSVTDVPDSNTDAVSISINGLLQSSTQTTPQPAITYGYDTLGRETTVTSPVTGTSTKVYSATTGQLISVGDGAQSITYEYYPSTHTSAGQLKAQSNAQGKKLYFNYNSRGETVQTWGDTAYPLEYVYDAYGQRVELHTFRSGSSWSASAWPSATTGPADVTRWFYHEPTGLVEKKQDAALKQVVYTYDALRRISTRAWARPGGITATYAYDPQTAELTGMDYSDTTPDVTFQYDRGGRQSSVTDAAGTHTRAFNARSELQTEQIAGGILDQVQVSAGYDSFLRRQSLQVTSGATVIAGQTYAYDSALRLETITSGAQSVTYAYYPATGLLNTMTFTGGAQTARSYDALGRLQSITTSTPAAGTVAGYTYTYNNLSQRTRTTREDGSYWSYSYNDRGELVFGKKYWADNTLVWGQQTEYDYDGIGNRVAARAGGNEVGNLRQAGYTVNSLNQYVQRTNPGAVDLMGTAHTAASVTVNDQPTVRKGDYFYKEVAVDNSGAPVYAQVSVVGARQNYGAGGEDAVTQKGGRIYLAQAQEAYSYDADGNLSADGRWNYTWDAENRLVAMEAIATVPVEARQRLEFAYDWMGRRIQKRVYTWNTTTSAYQLLTTTKFVYDGWTLMAELNAANAPVRSYVWNEQGANGLGGLLLVNEGANSYLVGHDGNGNVAALVNAGTGNVAASYDYNPFGEAVKATGEYAARNPFQFSTKYTDGETGLLYYGYRYYNPSAGRWLSKDPIEEQGGLNLYAFVSNDSVNRFDQLGQFSLSDYAERKMWDLFKNHSDEVGTEFPGDRRGRKPTNCIIYIRNVLEYAYEKMGRRDVADQIHRMPKEGGVALAQYLVALGWRAHYWNPDSKRTNDGRDEHKFTYDKARRTGRYYEVPVSGFIVDYNPIQFEPRKQTWSEWLRGIQPPQPTPKRMDAFNRFSGVKFAYGLASGGMHTFLDSYGMILEVHWREEGDRLYEHSPFYFYKWRSGLMLVPPDASFSSDPN